MFATPFPITSPAIEDEEEEYTIDSDSEEIVEEPIWMWVKSIPKLQAQGIISNVTVIQEKDPEKNDSAFIIAYVPVDLIPEFYSNPDIVDFIHPDKDYVSATAF